MRKDLHLDRRQFLGSAAMALAATQVNALSSPSSLRLSLPMKYPFATGYQKSPLSGDASRPTDFA